MKLGEMYHGYEPKTYAPHPLIDSSNDLVGLEIELEDCPILAEGCDPSEELFLWDVGHDDSLRGTYPVELRFRYPLAGADIVQALDQLNRSFEVYGIVPSVNARTSLHVHIDVRDLSASELYTLLAAYTATEDLLFNYAGPNRSSNIYCVPWCSGEHNVELVQSVDVGSPDDAKSIERLYYIVCANAHKYSSLNIQSVHERGSIEFRFSEAKYTTKEVVEYVNILLRLKEFARDNAGNIFEIPKMASGTSIKAFIETIYDKYADILYYVGCETSVFNGVRLAQRMLYGNAILSVNNVIRYKWLGEENEMEKTTHKDVTGQLFGTAIEHTMWVSNDPSVI